MNIIELKNSIDAVIDEYRRIGYSDKQIKAIKVVIPNEKTSYGRTSVTEVKSAHEGIDFDCWQFFIYPAVPMKEEVEK